MEKPPNKRLREYIDVGHAVDTFRQSLDATVREKTPHEMKKKPKLKIKFILKPKNKSKFKRGEIVEVSSDEEGFKFKGAWFVATIVDTTEKERYIVEYRNLMNDEDGTQHLIEEIDAKFIRPCPPKVPIFGCFKMLQEVDAWYNYGWWEGMVVKVVDTTKECFVRFMNNQVLKIEFSKLRVHQDWIDSKWVISSKESSEPVKKFGEMTPKTKNQAGKKLILKCPIPSENAKQHSDMITETIYTGSKFVLRFYTGEKVEIRSDEKGYEGSWYAATIVDFLCNGKYLVEYLTLKTDDLTRNLREVVDFSDIRPYPPDIIDDFCRFMMNEKVDAWYNEGWWEGVVSSVIDGFNGLKYKVYFWTTNEELEFEHCYLRPHQEWINGRWMLLLLRTHHY